MSKVTIMAAYHCIMLVQLQMLKQPKLPYQQSSPWYYQLHPTQSICKALMVFITWHLACQSTVWMIIKFLVKSWSGSTQIKTIQGKVPLHYALNKVIAIG